MKLYDLAKIMRSKNAGPFTLTIDLIFSNGNDFQTVMNSTKLTPQIIAKLYGTSEDKVSIHPFERILAIKITMPRPHASSGAPGDRDVYGSQHHFPLGQLEI